MENKTLKDIHSRFSTRNFSSSPVPEDALLQILNAGMVAPVGMRRYDTLHLTVVTNSDFFRKITEKANMATAERPTAPLYNAPVLIFVSSKIEREDHIEYANVGCVMENMALAATSLGIDSIYLWGFLRLVRSDPELLATLALPAGFTPISALAIGYGTATQELGQAQRHTIDVSYVK